MRILTGGGAEIATAALEANLVDQFLVVIHPVMVGGGKPALRISSRRNFTLVDPRRFDTGAVYLRYDILSGAGR